MSRRNEVLPADEREVPVRELRIGVVDAISAVDAGSIAAPFAHPPPSARIKSTLACNRRVRSVSAERCANTPAPGVRAVSSAIGNCARTLKLCTPAYC